MYVRSYSTLQSIYEILAECDFKSLLNKSVKFHGDTIYFSHEKKLRRGGEEDIIKFYCML